MTIRKIQFTNFYAEGDDGTEIANVQEIDVPDTTTDDDLRDLLFPYTGTGRSGDTDAIYSAISVDDLRPIIEVEWS